MRGTFWIARRSSRGFTLVELAIVVVIISVFAAMAMPQIVYQMRDRRVHETAQRVMHLYRLARERAIGRGGAVMVRYQTSGAPQGRFQVFDGRMGVGDGQGCALLPNPSCTGVDWNDTAANGAALEVTDWDLATDGAVGATTFARMNTHTAGEQVAAVTSFAEVCFTPFGRTFVRYSSAAGTAWDPLNGVPVAEVFRSNGGMAGAPFGLLRRVIILPSGSARLETAPL